MQLFNRTISYCYNSSNSSRTNSNSDHIKKRCDILAVTATPTVALRIVVAVVRAQSSRVQMRM